MPRSARGVDMEMGEIASRAALGIGTLYRHFANREDLLRAIVVHTLDDTLKQFQTAVASTVDDPRAALLAFVSVGLRVQQQYGPLFPVIRDPKLMRTFAPTQPQTFRNQFTGVILAILD